MFVFGQKLNETVSENIYVEEINTKSNMMHRINDLAKSKYDFVNIRLNFE